jgi:predicted acetyltransferase
VPYITALPGHGNWNLLDAFNDDVAKVPIIQTMHEQGAVHIADAHYRVTGEPIAVCTSIGPGAANTVMGLANAHCDSTALLLITGSASTHMRGHGVMQEMDRENTPDFINVTRPVTKRNFDVIRAKTYAAKAAQEAGLLNRGQPHWNELRRKSTDALAAYLAAGEAAYLILDMGNEDCLDVRDWYAGSPEAAQGVLSFLARFRSVYPVVRWHGGPHDDLVAAMPDKGWRLAHQEEWLARVLDPATALRQRGYHADDARLALRIGEAETALEIEIKAGAVEVREATGACPTVVLQTQAFVQIFTGFRSASKLAQYGQIVGTAADIRLCDQLFAGPSPWVAEHF